MQIIVGTTPVQVPGGGRTRALIQNLGPGNIYLDTEGSVDATSGLRIAPNEGYEFPTAGASDELWLVADAANTDVRHIRVG